MFDIFKKRTRSVRTVLSAEIRLNGVIVPYKIKKSNTARHARITITSDSELSVILPMHFSDSYAEQFILDKQQWIINKLEMLRRLQPEYIDAAHVQYLGKPLTIHRQYMSGETPSAELVNEKLVISAPVNITDTEPLVKSWLKTHARHIIPHIAAQNAEKMSVSYKAIHIRSARTRWGSCSQNGNLNFNWKLIMLPQEIIEYVVIHELCHLRQMNHSPAFWQLVAQYCPDWKTKRRLLRNNERALSF